MARVFIILLVTLFAFVAGLWVQKTQHILPVEVSNTPVATPNQSSQIDLIRQTLTKQAQAWSSGDIDRFMQDYWKSNQLRFASGDTVKRGWQTTLDRYKLRYPDRATMGTLDFTELEIEILSPEHALVFGRWTLTREGDTPSGLFTLHMKKTGKGWKIVSDHTSSATP